MKLLAKVVEIRDSGTCIAAIAIRMVADSYEKAQNWLIHERSGYPRDGTGIVLMRLGDQQASVDPYGWSDTRTMGMAHNYIYENFHNIEDGQVIDVRVLWNETKVPVKSDRFAEADRFPGGE